MGTGSDSWTALRTFGPRGLGFLSRAFAATYRVAFEPELFERSLHATVTRVGQALSTLPLVRGLMGEGLLLPPVGRTLRAIYRTGAVRHVSLAYVTPVQPSPWLLQAVRQEGRRHGDRMREARATDGASLKDWNLDTGRLLETEDSHPGTRRAMEALDARCRVRPAEA